MGERAEHITYWTADAYLEMEHASSDKHEYVDGIIYAMVGVRDVHNLVAGNIFAGLRQQLRGGPCQVFIADMKVQVRTAEMERFYYPDVLVSCDPSDRAPYVREAPSLVVEVLSPTTERNDRSEKFHGYCALPSLETYVLVHPDRREVEVFRRLGDFRPEMITSDGTLEFAHLGAELTLDDVYEGVDVA